MTAVCRLLVSVSFAFAPATRESLLIRFPEADHTEVLAANWKWDQGAPANNWEHKSLAGHDDGPKGVRRGVTLPVKLQLPDFEGGCRISTPADFLRLGKR